MTTEVLTTSAERSVAEVTSMMVKIRVGSAVVMEGSWLAGILTERDVLRAAASGSDLTKSPDPKIHDEQAGGSTRRSAAEPGAGRVCGAGLGGGLEGDLVAERFELADVVALGALGVDVGVVEAGPQVVEAGGRVGQQVPDDDQDGAADRHDGSLGAAAAGDAPVALAQEGVG